MFRMCLLVWSVVMPAMAATLPAENQLRAILGVPPYVGALEAGVPLPPHHSMLPSPDSALFSRQAIAFKRVMLLQTVKAAAERGRVSMATYAACAAAAEKWQLPEPVQQLFHMLADTSASPRKRYEAEKVLRLWLRAYRVDATQMRVLVELVPQPAPQMLALAELLPLPFVFNMASSQVPAQDEMEADVRTMAEVMEQMSSVLASVHDKGGADAAANELLPLLQLWSTTLDTRYALQHAPVQQLPPANETARLLMHNAHSRLLPELCRMQEARWFGSVWLQTLHMLFL